MRLLTIGIPLFACVALAASAADSSGSIPDLQKVSGVTAGLCVVVDGGDGKTVGEFARTGRFIVHGLALDRNAVVAAREKLASETLCGIASIDALTSQRLPHAENLVNLLIIEDLQALLKRGVPATEIMRVMAPNGVACAAVTPATKDELVATLKQAGIVEVKFVDGAKPWAVIRKPRPPEMDDWSHFNHAPDGNPVSKDTLIQAPNQLQWIAGPAWNGARADLGPANGAPQCVLSANGNNYYLQGTRLVARDACNGILRWTRSYQKLEKTSIVAAGDELYVAADGEVSALSAFTGEVLRSITKSANGRLLFSGTTLLVLEASSIRAFEAATAKPRWQFPQGGAVLADANRIFVSGKELSCVDLATGNVQWKKNLAADVGPKARACMVASNGALLCRSDDQKSQFTLHSAADGSKMWSYESNKNNAGAYCAAGMIWIESISDEPTTYPDPDNAKCALKWKPSGWAGLDLATGKVARTIKAPVVMPYQCYNMYATERFLITNRPAYFVDWKSGAVSRFEGTRPACGSSFCVASGMYFGLYTNSNLCMCVHASISGVTAFASDGKTVNGRVAAETETALELGTATPPESMTLNADDWPMYRCDMMRTASKATGVALPLAVAWHQNLAAPAPRTDGASKDAQLLTCDWRLNKPSYDALTAPTVGFGKVFVAMTHGQQLLALDQKTGQTSWSMRLSARLDTPPTLHDGLCLFGCHDGWVYCVRADDGKLVWRYRAAPAERRIVAYGQLESAWPVIGGVLLVNGVAYVIAGRSTECDGGLYVTALDPKSGKVLWHGENVKPDNDDYGPYNPRVKTTYVGAADMLSSDGKTVAIAGCQRGRFDLKTGQQISDYAYRGPTNDWKQSVGWMQSRYTSDRFGTLYAPVTFLEKKVIAVRNDAKTKQPAIQYLVKDGWKTEVPAGMLVEALAVAGDQVVAAVSNNKPSEPGGELWVLSAKDGSKLATHKLSAAPALDGLAIAAGGIWVTLQDGSVLCLKGK